MKFLVVNADDFGYTVGVNNGIIKAHSKGIVTSASLMVNGLATMHAVELASEFPNLAIGLHFQMTGEGLVSLIRTYAMLRLSSRDAVKQEFELQLAKFEKITGHKPTHIDSHHHIHLHPQLRPIFEQYSSSYNVPARGLAGNRFIRDFFGWNSLRQPSLDQVSVDTLINIISNLPEGINEIMCHPAVVDDALKKATRYADERELELSTLTNPEIIARLKGKDVQLLSWADAWKLKNS